MKYQIGGFSLNQKDEVTFSLEVGKDKEVLFYASEELIKNFDTAVFEQAQNVALLEGVMSPVIVMPDAHSGYGAPIGTVFASDANNGIVSPGAIGYDINCGMRLIRTNLKWAEITRYIERLVNLLYQYVPAGVGRKGVIKFSKADLKQITSKGAYFMVQKGFGLKEDLDFIEDKGVIGGGEIEAVSETAQQRGLVQLGTLGSGNHYLEIQRVDEIIDTKTAYDWGITEKDQVVVMFHCGSRGFGHQVCSDYVRLFLKHNQFGLPDKQLAAAPIKSSWGQNYLAAMVAAANFAFANRQLITYQIRRAFEKVLGIGSQKLGMKVVYDVAHNIGKFEEHVIPGINQKRLLFIHRKGATRAFVDQPVIIGGSMESGSYLLKGSTGAMQKSFGSTCHGSGRVMSRSRAKKLIQGAKLLKKIKQKGIYVKSASLSGLAEEAGMAYKDINLVVEAVAEAGLSTPVAVFKPIGNVKG